MNETTPPPGTPGTGDASGAGGAPTPPVQPAPPAGASNRFFSWLHGLGIVRSSDRWFAGVAGGIAAKAGIDPLIVRGIFVVLAILGGPGILLYLAGWLLLPDASGRIHLEELFRGRASAGVTVTIVIIGAIILLPFIVKLLLAVFAGGTFWGWGMFGFAPDWLQVAMSLVWWLLLVPAAIIWLIVWLVNRGSRGGGSAPSTAHPAAAPHGEQPFSAASAAPATHATNATFQASADGTAEPLSFAAHDAQTTQTAQTASFADRAEAFGRQAGQKAEEWGQRAGEWGEKVGADATAWAEQHQLQHQQRRLGAAHVVLTLAAALLAAAGAAGWALASGAVLGSPIPGDGSGAVLIGIIAGLAVLAISLIVAGIRGKSSGWIGFLSFCGVVVLFFTSVLPWGGQVQPFGNSTVTVTGQGGPSGLTVIAGNARIDLTELEEPQDFALWVLAGNATIDLPDDMPVVVRVIVGAGNIRDHRDDDVTLTQSGPFLGRTVGANLEGAKRDEVSRITVRLLAGNVNINGANAAPGLSEQYANALPQPPSAPRDRQILEYAS